MRVFVTGATGFIGAAVTRELIAAGHQVTGLCRSDDKAAALAAVGAEVLRGTLADRAGLEAAAADADGVIHLAFNHDFSTYMANCEDDREAIKALGKGLAGAGKPLIVTSGILIANPAPGRPVQEDDPALGADMTPRAASEEAARSVAGDGVMVSVVRLPQIHDTARQGLISMAIQTYIEKGVCAYIGDGSSRWAATHVLDTARLYRLALEKAESFAVYNAVGEEGVTMRDIAETLGRRLGLPVRSITMDEAGEFFGFLAMFADRDGPASSAQTRAKLGWRPTGPTLLADLENLVMA